MIKWNVCSIIFSLAIGLFSWPVLAQTGPQGITLQGELVDGSNHPVESVDVDFTIQVLSAEPEKCVLYEETHQLDMTGSKGSFSLSVGKGSRSATAVFKNTNTLLKALSNAEPAPSETLDCAVGYTGYTPAANHNRFIRLSFNDNSGSGTQVVNQDLAVGSAPYALYADSLQGKTPSDFIQKNVAGGKALTQTNLENVFQSTAYVTELLALIDGTSSRYAKPQGGGQLTVATPVASTDAANKSYVDSKIGGSTLDLTGLTTGQSLSWDGSKWVAYTPVATASGSAGGDLTGTYPNPGVGAIRGNSVQAATLTGTDTGKVYRWNGTSTRFEPAYLNFGDLKTNLGGAQFGTSCTSNQTLTWSAVTDAFACTSIGSLPASAISSGTLDAARFPALTGDVTTSAGAVATTIATGAVTSAKIADGTIDTADLKDGGVSLAKLGTDVGKWSVNGTKAYRSSGYVGILNNDPMTPLHIGAGGELTSSPTKSVGAASPHILLSNPDSGGSVSLLMGVNDGSRNTRAEFFMNDDSTPGNGGWGLWSTYSTGGAQPFILGVNDAEALRIDIYGQVGIGTANPGARLAVYGDAGAPATSGTTQNGIFRIEHGSSDNAMDFGSLGSAPWTTWIQSANRATLATNNPLALNPNGGNVGVSTIQPHSSLQVAGSFAQNLVSKTSAYTLTSADAIVSANASGGAFTLTLPSAASIAGRTYTMKKVDSSGNAVTIATTSSQTIDGSTTYSLSAQWSFVTVVSNGSNWLIIAK